MPWWQFVKIGTIWHLEKLRISTIWTSTTIISQTLQKKLRWDLNLNSLKFHSEGDFTQWSELSVCRIRPRHLDISSLPLTSVPLGTAETWSFSYNKKIMLMVNVHWQSHLKKIIYTFWLWKLWKIIQNNKCCREILAKYVIFKKYFRIQK